MKKNNRITPAFIAYLFVGCLSITGCSKKETAQDNPDPNAKYSLRLTFKNKVGPDALVLNTNYINPHGEPIKITSFKYYISNIILVDGTGIETKLPDTYFLVNAADPASQTFTVLTTGSNYKTVRFLIGVDSTRNVSGVQTGALDPANGMFWTWDSGYIMARLEGSSTIGGLAANFSYDIIGFKGADATQRKISLTLPINLLLKTNTTSEVIMSADINAWFKGVNDIKIASNPSSVAPGPLAMKIADNYAHMFAVEEVKN